MVSEKEKSEENKDLNVPPRGKEWERGFTVEENRVAEYVELYESIGYEVRVESATPDDQEECQTCFKTDFDNLRTIYIKRKENRENEKDLEELM
ncbi:MAG: hypothetical protein CEE43_09325 [Promethearchaeota archaeon Loki_b32]|nr:MAG: hypothetical protein CEE43_09325 [Candidatus Lokiarchaeota archaeon Loki_b32]